MRVALITGAAQGVGFATAKMFADTGYHVVMTDVQPLDAQIAMLAERGGSVSALSGDISSEAFVIELAKKKTFMYSFQFLTRPSNADSAT